MPIKNGWLISKGSSISLDGIEHFEIQIMKKEEVIVDCAVLIRFRHTNSLFRNSIDICDMEPLEDYLIDREINYSIITKPTM